MKKSYQDNFFDLNVEILSFKKFVAYQNAQMKITVQNCSLKQLSFLQNNYFGNLRTFTAEIRHDRVKYGVKIYGSLQNIY